MIFKTTIIFVIIYLVYGSNAGGVFDTLEDVKTSLLDQTKGIKLKLPDKIPTPDAFFSLTKNALAGFPFEVIFDAFNTICSDSLASNTVRSKYTPKLEDLHFLLMTTDGNHSIPFEKPELIWEHKDFDKNKGTEILLTGWTTDVDSANPGLSRIHKAYACRGEFNFIAIDTARFIETLYTWSAFNTEEIGKLLAHALTKLVEHYPRNKIHLIGHSLGAHIVGATGREFKRLTGHSLHRITGLDPAKPCFKEGERLGGLSRGDAEFVDVIHSNNGVLGKREAIGDVDFYPDGMEPLPPGCKDIICAHSRAYDYYAESVYPGNEHAFMARKCNSISAYNNGDCRGQEFPMGLKVHDDLKGNYFLKTNSHSPFGFHSKKLEEISCRDKKVVVTKNDYLP